MDKQAYMISQLTTLTGIPSPTGMTREITDYLLAELTRLGFKPQRTPKGTVICCLGRQRPSPGALRPCGRPGGHGALHPAQRLPALHADWRV